MVEIDELIREYNFSENNHFSVIKLKKFISMGRTNEAVEMLQKNKYDSEQLQNQIGLISSRWARLKKDRIKGIVTIEDSRIQENALISAMLDLVVNLR